MVYAVIVGLVVLIALSAGAAVRARHRAAAIEAGDLPTPEKVHALRRLSLWVSFGSLLVIMIGAGALGAAAGGHRHRHTAPQVVALVAGLALYLLAFGLIFYLSAKVIRPALARVRDVPVKPANRKRALLVVVPTALLLGALIAIGLALAPRSGGGRIVAVAVTYLVVLVGIQSLLAPLIAVALRSRPLDDATHARLVALADRMHCRVRDFRAFEGREQRVANALQVGTLPRLRYILISDYLLDRLDDDEIDAVVAHELGHVRGRHVLIKLLAFAMVWAALQAVLVGMRGTDDHGAIALAALPLVLALPLGVLAVNGLLGVRLERRADDAACAATGPTALADALDKVASLNDAKRDTGRIWSVLTQHPGFDERLARLRQDGSGAAAGSPVASPG